MDYESQLRLRRDERVVRAALEAAGGELIRREDDPDGLYWARIQPSGTGGESFIARIQWSVYPDKPPSLLFAPAVGGLTGVASAWPAASGYRAPIDVCKPFTAEGQALHVDWGSGPNAWRAEGNPFLYVLETVQADIDRAKGVRAA